VRASAEARVIASRYAKALLQVVIEKKEDPERIDSELGEVVKLFESHPALGQILASPAVVSSRRVAIVDRLFSGSKVSQTTANLLRVMAAKKPTAGVQSKAAREKAALEAMDDIAKAIYDDLKAAEIPQVELTT